MKKLLPIALLMFTLGSCKQNQTKEVYYNVDAKTSKANWKGSGTDHFHVGSFDVTGNLTTNQNKITGGEFVIPIISIRDFDLKDPIRQTLLADLKSANFFNVAIHPTATFKITKVDTCLNSKTGANYTITGDFAMVGQIHTISFDAKITNTADNINTIASFTIDRTKWGMKIYSDPKQKLFIYPDVNINLGIKAEKSKSNALAFLAPYGGPVLNW